MEELLKDEPIKESGEKKEEINSETKSAESSSNQKEEKKEDKPTTTKKKSIRKKSSAKKSTAKSKPKKEMVDDGPTQHDIAEKEVKATPKKELLNIKEAADFIGVDFKTMRNMVSTGNVPLNWSQSMGYVIRVTDLIKIKKQINTKK
jgi:glucan-binding YG repeat protein